MIRDSYWSQRNYFADFNCYFRGFPMLSLLLVADLNPSHRLHSYHRTASVFVRHLASGIHWILSLRSTGLAIAMDRATVMDKVFAVALMTIEMAVDRNYWSQMSSIKVMLIDCYSAELLYVSMALHMRDLDHPCHRRRPHSWLLQHHPIHLLPINEVS